jgi:hypothetical protein
MELIGMADERVFKKLTKLTVMSSFYCLTVFAAPYRLQTSPGRNAPDVIYLYFSLSRLPRMNSSIMVELGTLSLAR